MKFAVLVFSLFSSVTFACPNLSGTFVATFTDGTTEEMVITQSEINGVTNYSLVFDGQFSVTAIADGVSRTTEINESTGAKMLSEDTYSCTANAFTNTYFARYIGADGTLAYEEKGTETFSLDTSGNIINNIEYSTSNGQKGAENYTYIRK